jgi:hypothetical protein
MVSYDRARLQHLGALSTFNIKTIVLIHDTKVFYAYAFDFTAYFWRGLMIDVSGLFLAQDATPPTCMSCCFYFQSLFLTIDCARRRR